jgi:hypothetical protein
LHSWPGAVALPWAPEGGSANAGVAIAAAAISDKMVVRRRI